MMRRNTTTRERAIAERENVAWIATRTTHDNHSAERHQSRGGIWFKSFFQNFIKLSLALGWKCSLLLEDSEESLRVHNATFLRLFSWKRLMNFREILKILIKATLLWKDESFWNVTRALKSRMRFHFKRRTRHSRTYPILERIWNSISRMHKTFVSFPFFWLTLASTDVVFAKIFLWDRKRDETR